MDVGLQPPGADPVSPGETPVDLVPPVDLDRPEIRRPERDLGAWDVAAGPIIVKEAAGFISDIDDIRKNPVNTGNILAANENMFDPISRILKNA